MTASNRVWSEWIALGVGFYLQRTHIVWYEGSKMRVIASDAEGGLRCICDSSI
jgi:hypothetical protein